MSASTLCSKHRVRWACMIACIVIACAWFMSGWLSVLFNINKKSSLSEHLYSIGVSSGRLRIHIKRHEPAMTGWFGPLTGLEIKQEVDAPRWRIRIRYHKYQDQYNTDWMLWVPLWIPAAMCCLLTLLLWRRRRPVSGYCRCGYSRAGLAGGVVCPECGVAGGIDSRH